MAYSFPLLAFAIAILFAWSGCATYTKNPTKQEIIQYALNEHLHQDHFAKRLGPPHRTMTLKSGEAVWVYESSGVSFYRGTGSSYCESDILTFGQDGKLRDWREGGC